MRKIAIWPALLAAALVAGCVGRPYPEKNHFALSVGLPAAAEAAARPYTIVTGSPAAAPGFEERLLVRRVGPNRYEADFYNELVAAPARLVADAAAQYLNAALRKARVARGQGMRLADFGLETYVAGFYGDYAGDGPQAVVSVRFTLNDLRGAAAKVVLDRTYNATVALADKTPASLVAGESRGLEEILRALAADCAAALR